MNAALRTSCLCFAVLFLAGCSSVQERQQRVINWWNTTFRTASGAVHNTKGQVLDGIQQGKTAIEGVQEMIDDTQQRIEKVQEGVDLLLEGKDLIEEGVQGE